MPRTARLTVAEIAIFSAAEILIIARKPRTYLRAQKRARRFGRLGFFAYPRSCDEKYHWRKIFDHAPVFTRLSDKLAVRDWYEEMGCTLQTPKVVWVGQSSRDIPADLRVSNGVLKSNHASRHNIMLEGCHLSDDELDELTQAWLAEDFGRTTSEWGYRNVPRCLFVEERIGDAERPIEDWKFYTFGRRVERIVHLVNLADGRAGQVFEPDGKGGFFRLARSPAAAERRLEGPKPAQFEMLLEEARALGAPFDHMRVDFLVDGTDAFAGEMTVYNQSGWITDGGELPETQISRAWDLRRSWFLTSAQTGWFTRLYARALRRALDRSATGSDLPPA